VRPHADRRFAIRCHLCPAFTPTPQNRNNDNNNNDNDDNNKKVRPPSKSFADVVTLAMAVSADKSDADVSGQARGGPAVGSAWAKASPAAVLALAANDSTLHEPLLAGNPAS